MQIAVFAVEVAEFDSVEDIVDVVVDYADDVVVVADDVDDGYVAVVVDDGSEVEVAAIVVEFAVAVGFAEDAA